MTKAVWPPAFLAAVAVHLLLLGLDATPWDSITKCLLAPLLVAWVVTSRGPRLLVWAMLLCFLGDLFLELDGWFIAGMAAFAAAHVCLVTLFVGLGALEGLRARPWIVGVYVIAAAAVVAWAWGGLPVELRGPVPVYAALLLATAATAAVVDRLAGIGGLLFLVSDGIIVLGVAERIDPDALLVRLSIMALYAAAIALLTAGLLRSTAPRADDGASVQA